MSDMSKLARTMYSLSGLLGVFLILESIFNFIPMGITGTTFATTFNKMATTYIIFTLLNSGVVALTGDREKDILGLLNLG